MTSIQPYQPQPPTMWQTPGISALQNLEAQAQAMGHAMTLADAMCKTEMVPKHFRGKPMDGAAAILYGAELGLNAIQSLQQIMVINGKPGIETRTAVALLKKYGYEIRTVESSPESVTVEGAGPRGENEVSTWTMQRAQTAGFTSNTLYKKIPEQMLYAKAAMEVARKIAPHVLSGIAYSLDELRLEPVQAVARRTDRRGGSALDRAKATPQPEPTTTDTVAISDTPESDWVASLEAAATFDQITEIMGNVQTAGLPAEEFQTIATVADQRWEELAAQEAGN